MNGLVLKVLQIRENGSLSKEKMFKCLQRFWISDKKNASNKQYLTDLWRLVLELYIKELHFPDSIFQIDPGAINFCLSLQNIIISPFIVSIGNFTYINCNIVTAIFISTSMTKIGKSTFQACTYLETISVDANNKYFAIDYRI